MTVHIALLRGINVGGHNKIKMAELRQSLAAMGLSGLQTYIQSGNVLFASEQSERELREALERRIADDFGMALTVVLRTAAELEAVVRDCPFSAEEVAEAEAIAASAYEPFYVALLPEPPGREAIDRLGQLRDESGDECRIRGREVYLLCRQSVRSSKLADRMSKLGSGSTMRNWRTMNKLVELARGMKE